MALTDTQIKNLQRYFITNYWLELFCLSILFLASMKIFSLIDPREMLEYGVFLWDSGWYKALADNFYIGNYSDLKMAYPFGTRVLFPFLYAHLSKLAEISLIESAYALNVFSTYIVLLLTNNLWKKIKLPIILRLVGLVLFLFFSGGPLRYAGYYPGGSFAFEILLVLLLFMLIKKVTTSSNTMNIISIGMIICILSFGREVITYLLLITMVMMFIGRKLFQNTLIKDGLLRCYLKNSLSIPINKLAILFLFSLIGYVGTRILVGEKIVGAYSILNVINTSLWLHLHIAEFLYPFFYALGPFFLTFTLVLLFKKTREKLIDRICCSDINWAIYFPFSIAGIIFMMVGGSDSDRFLLWFFPFYGGIGLMAAEILIKLKIKRVNYSLILILLVGLVWTRFYVPAIPHLIFPGDNYNSMAGVRTNYNPDLYFGTPYMEKFRLPLKKVPEEDTVTVRWGARLKVINPVMIPEEDTARWGSRLKVINSAMIPEGVSKDGDNKSPYTGVYRYNVNSIPFPFGFAHNQYELLIAHPTHGGHRVKVFILFQWLITLGFIVFWNRKVLKR